MMMIVIVISVGISEVLIQKKTPLSVRFEGRER